MNSLPILRWNRLLDDFDAQSGKIGKSLTLRPRYRTKLLKSRSKIQDSEQNCQNLNFCSKNWSVWIYDNQPCSIKLPLFNWNLSEETTIANLVLHIISVFWETPLVFNSDNLKPNFSPKLSKTKMKWSVFIFIFHHLQLEQGATGFCGR